MCTLNDIRYYAPIFKCFLLGLLFCQLAKKKINFPIFCRCLFVYLPINICPEKKRTAIRFKAQLSKSEMQLKTAQKKKWFICVSNWLWNSVEMLEQCTSFPTLVSFVIKQKKKHSRTKTHTGTKTKLINCPFFFFLHQRKQKEKRKSTNFTCFLLFRLFSSFRLLCCYVLSNFGFNKQCCLRADSKSLLVCLLF